MPVDWGALAGAIVDTQNGWLNFISQGMANRTNRQNVIDTNNQNAALAQQANQWNIDQWNRVNAYNSPSAQRARLEAAGLNPALVYGQGGLTNEASSMPGANVANMQAASAMAPQLPLIGSQVALNMAQANKLNAETKTEDQMRQAAYDNLVAQTGNLAEQNKEILARIQRYAKENELTDAQINQISEQLDISWRHLWNEDTRVGNESAMTSEQLKLIKQDIRKRIAEAKVSEKEFELFCDTYAQRVLGFKLDNGIKAADFKVAMATAEKLKLEKMILEPDATYAAAANRRGKFFGQTDKDYLIGDFMQYLVEYVARELGHVIH